MGRPPRSSRQRSEPLRWAAVYDRIYSGKDYEGEARRIRALIRTYGPRGARTLLDVACGTGAHLEALRRTYRCVGLDRDPAMLRRARRKLPGVPLVEGDLRAFDLGRTFDVVTCLFSAIGYVADRAELRAAVRTMAAHVAPGGLLIVEPWIYPGDWRPGSLHGLLIDPKGEPVVRVVASSRIGDHAVMTMHYLWGRSGRIRHWVERHEMLLAPDAEYRAAFRAAGLTVRRLPSGFAFAKDRGLYVGRKPGRPAPAGAG